MKLVLDRVAAPRVLAGVMLSLSLCLAFSSCGREASHRNSSTMGGASGSTGGVGAVGGVPGGLGGNETRTGGAAGTGTGAAVGIAGNGGGAGAAGGSGVIPPAVDISGRWGMFLFEDPVGVQLFQAPDGTLTGRGCFSGTPGGPTRDQWFDSCVTKVSGAVSGRSAWFGFPLDVGGPGAFYSVRVTVSDDAQRITGVFTTVGTPGDDDLKVAWLRVRDDADWLVYPSNELEQERARSVGSYALTLLTDLSTGTEFGSGRTYHLYYSSRGIGGDLGSFWTSETSRAAGGGPERVGPVSATIPALPTALEIDFLTTGPIRRITAKTPSGGVYVFSAELLP